MPVLIQAGLAHAQFETIHSFLDGNGRLGRLLITLLLCHSGMLDAPILYLSLYLKQNRTQYYELLQEVRLYGTWETWLEFFLEGIYQSAKAGIQTIWAITQLFESDLTKINALGRSRLSCEPIFDYLKQLPQVTVSLLVKELGLSAPTVRSALSQMVDVGILEEITAQKRSKIYVYRRYLDILEEGAEPLQS